MAHTNTHFAPFSLANVQAAAAQFNNSRARNDLAQLKIADYRRDRSEKDQLRQLMKGSTDEEGKFDLGVAATNLEGEGFPLKAREMRQLAKGDQKQQLEFKMLGMDMLAKTTPRVYDQKSLDAWRTQMEEFAIADKDELPSEWNEKTKAVLDQIAGKTTAMLEKFGGMQQIPGLPGHIGQASEQSGLFKNIKASGPANTKQPGQVMNTGSGMFMIPKDVDPSQASVQGIPIMAPPTASQDASGRSDPVMQPGAQLQAPANGPTGAQQANNGEIDAARNALRSMGLSREEVMQRTQRQTDTGRDNPNFDPYLAGLIKKATQRKVGSDPEFETLFEQTFTTGNAAPSSPGAPVKPPDQMSDQELLQFIGAAP